MPVKVKCTSCEKVLSVPDAARGKAIKCPACQTRIAVPAEGASPKPPAAKPKPKKPAKPADSEYALVTLDMRKAEDDNARICPKCGYDMKYQDEEDNECPQCGYDSQAGGLGARALKKSLKGPDPADFYPGLFKDGWRFVGRNISLAGRTIGYTLACLTISLCCAFLYLWISMWPPRAFLALCFTISILVIPGWMWVLDVEIIKLTLEGKDKFKKLNFDFFLASAMGLGFACWCVAVMGPLIGFPAALGYLIVNYSGGSPAIVFPICIAIGLIPSIWMLPVAMSHMAMPVPYKGWMVWKLVPMWARTIKPLSVWLLLFLATNIPAIAGITTIALVYGQDLVVISKTMEKNAEISRAFFDAQENPNAKRKSKGPPQPVREPVKLEDKKEVDFTPLIVPTVILVVMCIFNGFTCMFNMRTNGRFTYYNRGSLDMVDKRKEYKYIAKKRVDEDEDEAPKTLAKMLTEAVAFFLVFDLFGLVGGMLYGSFTEAGAMTGIFYGVYIAQSIAAFVNFIICVKLAFQNSLKWGAISLFGLFPIGFIVFVFQNFEERKEAFIQLVVGMVISLTVVIVGLVSGLLFLFGDAGPENQIAPPAVEVPAKPETPATANGTPAPTAEPAKP